MDLLNTFVDSVLGADWGIAPTNWPAALLGLLLSFAGGQIIAWVYMLTHSGLSYSRSFVNALIVMPVIVSLVMMVLSNNLDTGDITTLANPDVVAQIRELVHGRDVGPLKDAPEDIKRFGEEN